MKYFDRFLGVGICLYGVVCYDATPFWLVGGFLIGSLLHDAYEAYKQR